MKINRMDLFPIPIYHVPVPALEKHHDDIIQLFQSKIDDGTIKEHENGYGLQSLPNLFEPNAYGPGRDYFMTLGEAFCDACEEILYQTRNDAVGQFVWVNTLTIGWANLQTDKVWDNEQPWHTHLPAMLSGCYYVSTVPEKDEGNLQFFSPTTDNIFQPQKAEIVPQSGHMVIFPSLLKHRPTSSPSNKSLRIALCMDSHWTVQGRHQVPPEMAKRIPTSSEYYGKS